MPGWLFQDDAKQDLLGRFDDYIKQGQSAGEALLKQGQQQAVNPVQQAATSYGDQFQAYVNQRQAELAPQQAQVPQQSMGDRFMDYVNQAQAQAGSTANAAVDQAKQTVGNVAQQAAQSPLGQAAAGAYSDISQFGNDQLTAEEAYSACGPAAAVRWAQMYGRNPTLREATDLAKQYGWTPNSGMAGISSQQQLLKQMGVDTHVVAGARWDDFAREASSGNPITISTPGHYFFADAYDQASGKFHVGQSGRDLKAGSEWMSPQEMERTMGAAQGALFADHPAVPTKGANPSVVPDIKLDTSSPEAFIRSIAPAAQAVADRTGIPAAAMIGMAANETGFGKFAEGNNLFGIKGQGPAGSINAGTWEDYGQGPVQIRDAFRAYDNLTQSFQDFADLVMNAPRYAAAKGQQTVEGFVSALKAGGYMTDPNYVGKIQSIVDRYAPQIEQGVSNVGTAARQGVDDVLSTSRTLADQAGQRLRDSETMLRGMQADADRTTAMQRSEAETRRMLLQEQADEISRKVTKTGEDIFANIAKPRSFDNPLDQFQAGFRSPSTAQGTPSDDLTNPQQAQYNAPSAPFEVGKNLALAGRSAAGLVQGAGSALGQQLQGITPGSTMTPEEAVKDPIRAINEYGRNTQTGSGVLPAIQYASRAVAEGRYDDAIGEVIRRTSPGLGLAAEMDAGGIVSAGLKGAGLVGVKPIAGVEMADWIGLLVNMKMPAPALEGLGQYLKPPAAAAARILSNGLADWARTPLGQAFARTPERFQRGAEEWARAPIGEIAKDLMQGPIARFLVDESGELDVDRLVEVAKGFKQRAQDIVRMYHGGSSTFERADLARDSSQNIYGPGLYTTSDPRVAGGVVSEMGSRRPPEIQQQIDDLMAKGDKRQATMLRTQYPHQPGGDVLAPGYAQNRAPTEFNDVAEKGRQIDDLKARQKGWTDLAAKHPDNPGVAEGARVEIDKHQIQIDNLQQDIDEMTQAIPAGPNVRALDVPRNQALFDMDAPVDPDQLDAIGQAVGDFLGDPLDAQSFISNVRTQAGAYGGLGNLNGDKVWQALVGYMRTFARSAPGSNYDVSPQAQANQVLEAMGYAGIKHQGGKRVPMVDPTTGQPVEHDVRILFQKGLDQARNAYQGGPAAFTSPIAGAAGAEAAVDENDPNRGLKIGTASLVGLMAGPRGARQAAIAAAELAGKTAPISPSREIIQAAKNTLSVAARAIPTDQPERALAPVVERYSRESLHQVMEALTPNRIASLQGRVVGYIGQKLAGGALDNQQAQALALRIWHSGLDQLQDTLTVISGQGDLASLALARRGQFTGKFTQGDFEQQARISQAIVNNAQKPGEPPRLDMPGARDFTLREGPGSDVAFTGGTQMADPQTGQVDPGALMRTYGYIGAGEPLVSTQAAPLYIVWKPETPMVATFHHHFGPLAPDYPAHVKGTPEGLRKMMWEGEQSLVGATTTDVGSPLGARKVGWEAEGVDVGDGRKIASTDLAVGASGAADMRMATLIAGMPQAIQNAIKGGRLTDPDVIAALLLRGESARIQPARLAAIDVMNPVRTVGKPANKIDPSEARALNQAAIKQSNRTEALVLDPRVEDIQAIYLNQPPGKLTQRMGLVRDNPDSWSVQRVAEEIAARAKAAGNDIPVRNLDPTPEIAGTQIVRTQPKMMPEAETIGGAQGAPPIAPGRQRIVDNYMRAPGAQYLGGAAAGAAAGAAETDENDPNRLSKLGAAAIIGAVAPGAMRNRGLASLLARNVPRVAGGLAGAAASEFSMTEQEKQDTLGRVNRDILGALAGSVAPGTVRGAMGLARGAGPDLAQLRATFDFAAHQMGPPKPGTNTSRTVGGEFIATSKDFMLSALGTHVMNIGSQLTEMLKQPLVAAVEGREQDALLSLIAAGGSIPDAWRAARQAVKTGRTSRTTPGAPSTLKAHPFLLALGAADDFFRVVAGNMGATMEAQRLIREAGAVTQQQMDAVIMHNSDDIFEAGKKAGATSVFSSEGGQGLGQRISDWKQNFLNSTNPGMQFLGAAVDALVPFSGVPDAIWKLGLQRTPVLSEAIHGWKLARGLAKGDARTASHEAAEMLVQSMVSMTIISNVAAGNITGPDNPERPSSVKIGGQWYDYKGWGPFQIPLAVPAAIYESATGVTAKQGKSGIDWSDPRVQQTALSATLRVMMDASYLNSAVDLAHAIGTEGLGPGALAKTAVSYTSRFSPALLASAAQGIDPVQRDVSRELPGAFGEQFQSRTPILSQQLPARVDPYTGAPEEREKQGFAGALLKQNSRTVSPLEVEINKLRQRGYTDVPQWDQYPKTVSRDGREIQLTEREQRQVATARGLLVRDYAKILDDKNYQKMTDAQKAAYWVRLLDRANTRNYTAWSASVGDKERGERLTNARRESGRLVAPTLTTGSR